MTSEDDFIKDYVKCLSGFSAALYWRLLQWQRGQRINTLFSPVAVYTTLAMTLAGAEGETEEELSWGMHFTKNYDHAELGALLKKCWTKSEGVEICAANQLFVLREGKIEEEFKEILRKHYAAELELLGGLPNAEAKRLHMNQWIEKETKGKIKDLLPDGCVTGEDVLMMVNALYFKGSWVKAFPVENTHPETFQKHDGTTVQMQMMQNTISVPYFELKGISAQAVKLPFLGDREWEMMIVLPSAHDGLPEIQTYMGDTTNLVDLLSTEFEVREVRLCLPKFKLSKCPPVDIIHLLTEMGIAPLFEPYHTNLLGISRELKPFASNIYHQVVLEVDEQGATAASATAVDGSNRPTETEPTFKVNRPFFVAIVRDGKIPCFLGHVYEPEDLV